MFKNVLDRMLLFAELSTYTLEIVSKNCIFA